MLIQGSDIFICEINSCLSKIVEVERMLEHMSGQFQLAKELYHRCRVCLIEAVNNAFIHGNHLNALKTVIITCLKFKKFIRFSVKDEGSGYNFEKEFYQTGDQKRLLEPSGRGIFFIKHYSDHVEFLDRGRIIQLDFYL